MTFALLTAIEGAFILGRGRRSTEPFRAADRSVVACAAAPADAGTPSAPEASAAPSDRPAG